MTNNEAEIEIPNTGFVLSEKLYIRLKFIVQTMLPAGATLYFTLGSVWGFPAVEQVLGSIAAFTTFLGVILGISNRSYVKSDVRYGGTISIGMAPDGVKLYSLELKGSPDDIDDLKEVTFKISGSS